MRLEVGSGGAEPAGENPLMFPLYTPVLALVNGIDEATGSLAAARFL
jgi:hypothetical protein